MNAAFQQVPLRQAGRWLSGGTPNTTNPDYWGGQIPWISSGSLTSFRIVDSDRRVTSAGAANGTRLVDAGTILMVVRGMSLKTEFRMGITQRTVAFGQDCKALVPGSQFDPVFLAYAISSRRDEILGIVDEAGHGTGRLNTDQLYAVQIPLPTPSEQRAIAEVLGALDDKIAANAKLVVSGESLMRSIAASSSDMTTVSRVAKQVTRQVKPDTFPTEVAHYSLPAFDDQARPELTTGGTIKSNKFLLDEPVVLMSKLNPRIPRLWNVPELPARMALASTEFVVLAPAGVGVTELWSVLAQQDVWTVLTGKVAGTSGSHQRVKPSEIMSLSIRDPRSLSTTRRDSLKTLGLRCQAARDETVRLATTRDALLPGLMSGKIRVRDADRVVGEAV